MRLDIYLIEENLVQTRSEGADLIKQGFVLVDGTPIKKTGFNIVAGQKVELLRGRKYASRAGDKLKGALETFQIELKDKKVVDIGSSTGGFTDCALLEGASQVFAYDVGKDQMIDRLRHDKRVELHEQTNILDVELPINDIAFIDVSFTSVKPIIKHIKPYVKQALILLKPQFETDGKMLKNGVLKDKKMHEKVLESFITYIRYLEFEILGFMPSTLKGKEGNLEYLFYIAQRG